MAKYRALERTFVRADGSREPRLVEVGEEITTDDVPARCMMPLDQAAALAKAAAIRSTGLRPAAAGFAHQVLMLAQSIGGTDLTIDGCTAFISAWAEDPRPIS